MKNYIIKRLFLIPFTLLGILILNFAIIQFAPGGPVEHTLAKYQGFNVNATGQLTGGSELKKSSSTYQGANGVPEDLVKALEKQFGTPSASRLDWKPLVKTDVSDLETAQKFLDFIDTLDDDDDVQHVYHNAEISDEIMEKLNAE